MEPHSHDFKNNAAHAVEDGQLRLALARVQDGFVGKRAQVVGQLPEFDSLREQGKTIRNHVLSNLDYYLERYEAAVHKHGGHVHWAETPGFQVIDRTRQFPLNEAPKPGAFHYAPIV